MKKIKISFEYHAFPIWIYDESGNLLENDSPKEIRNNIVIDDELVKLQEDYNHLFVDDGVDFKFRGFQSTEEEVDFQKRVHKAIDGIQTLIGKDYYIENPDWF